MSHLGKPYWRRSAVLAAAIGAWSLPAPAQAIPVFAHRFGVSCEACHTVVPELNAFGKSFRDAGYRWPVRQPQHGVLPVATKVNLAYTSASDPSGLPKAIVDEVEFLSFGPAGHHLSYRLEQYWLDGGNAGSTRDAYLEYNTDPMRAWRGGDRAQLDVQLGQFTLPLPNDPETLRPTQNHYAVFNQTAGRNSFDLFDDEAGVNLGYGNRYAAVNALLLRDADTMVSARVGPDALSIWGYEYQGTRPIAALQDRFVRRGAALTSVSGRSQASLLLQTGSDSNPFGDGKSYGSSGGYLQEEWAFDSRWIGVVRYDGVNGPDGFQRSTTVSLNYRPYDRARWTIEDVYQTQPRTTHTLNAAWLFAF